MTELLPTYAFRAHRTRAPGYLFAFGIDDLALDAPTGQTLTFDRNSTRTVYDSEGRIATLAYDQVPWSSHYNATAGVWETTYNAQMAATNLCLQSEDFGTTWSAIGTPTRTAAAKRCGDLVLDLIGDDAAGTLEGYSQVVTFTGNAVKAVSIFLAAGTSTSAVIRLRDTSAAANRLLAVVTWAAGVPSVAMTTGTHISTVTCYGGVYRFHFQTTSVTAANTNQVEVYPATTSGLATANTGTVYAGGVQAENHDYPTHYIKTTTGTVTTVADALSATFDQPIADFTVYARLARPPWADLAGTFPNILHVAGLGIGTGTCSWALTYNTTAREFRFAAYGTSQGNSYASVPAGSMIDVCVQVSNVTTDLVTKIDVGAGFGTPSSALGPVAAWATNTLRIGHSSSTNEEMNAGLRRLIIAMGARTLAELRGPQP